MVCTRLALPRPARLFSKCKVAGNSGSGDAAEEMSRRMMDSQALYEMTLPAGRPFVVRLDGVSFKRYTARMDKPFDGRLTSSLQLTTRDLMAKFGARTAFCQSDEISLLFGEEPLPTAMFYGGRIQKIASILAGMASVRFNWHMAQQDWTGAPTEVLEGLSEASAVFDARAFSLANHRLAMEALYWRHALDGRRNAVNMVANKYYTAREMHRVSLGDLIARLASERAVNVYADHPPSAMYGTFFKRLAVNHTGYNPITKQHVPAVRYRITARTFDWSTATDEERTEMAMAKEWLNHHPASLEEIVL